MLASARSMVRSRATSNRRPFDTVISISSPGFSFRASTMAWGRRTAKLLPHFATCITISIDIQYICISSAKMGGMQARSDEHAVRDSCKPLDQVRRGGLELAEPSRSGVSPIDLALTDL